MKRLPSPYPTVPPRLPLARAILAALLLLPGAAAVAGDLDGGSAEVVDGDPVEDWNLTNGARLTVNGGTTGTVQAVSGSAVFFNNATAQATNTQGLAVNLHSGASLTARNSQFLGGIFNAEGSSSMLIDSSVISRASDVPATALSLAGVSLNYSPGGGLIYDGEVLIDGTSIFVEDLFNSLPLPEQRGTGARLGFGKIDMINRSRIDAGNIGVLMTAFKPEGERLQFTVDDSTILSRRGAAFAVMAREYDSDYVILARNGSQISGGDGNLLLVTARSGTTTARTDTLFTVDDSRLAGNVTFDASTVLNGTLNVDLRNNAQIDGRFNGVTGATVGTGSTWLLTGDSNVGRLQLDATGRVGLGSGTTFNTLTVGEFVGNGGTLQFNTVLGDDSSLTDKLIITGDANGQANVRVLNAGGAGAQTNMGIELIRVGGASNAQFDLQGRAVGGQYEYFLFKEASNGGWYLRSQLPPPPDPCDTDPSLPECSGPVDPPVDPPIDPPIDPIDPVDPIDPIDPPPPVLRPETGAYLANQFALGQVLRHSWRDRQGGSTATDGVRGWAQVHGTQSRLAAVDDQLALNVDRSRLQVGADIGVFDDGRARVGLMGTAAQSTATSRSQLTGYGATGKLKGGAVGVYGNWGSDAAYMDASVQRGRFRNTVQGEGLAPERYDSNLWQSSLEAGYAFGLGNIGSTAVRLQPELQLVYTDASTDWHQEANGTVVRHQGESGLSGRLGLRLEGRGNATVGASVSPYVAANWYRDGAGNGIAFDNEVMKASTPRDRYELSAGARVAFRSGLSAWGGLGVMRGDHGYREATANVSMSYAW